MAVTPTDGRMVSDVTPHTASREMAPPRPDLWTVSYLPGRTFSRSMATTAMILAELATQGANGEAPIVRTFAAELSMDPFEAVRLALLPPVGEGVTS